MLIKVFDVENDKIEETIQNWLNAHPNIRIVSISQVKGDFSSYIITSVFYCDKKEYNDNYRAVVKNQYITQNIKQDEDTLIGKTNEYSIVMTSYGHKKIAVMKVIRGFTNLSLKETKELVESVPCTVKVNLTLETAKEIKRELEKAGAIIELRKR